MAKKSPVQKFLQVIESLQDHREPAYLLYGEEVYLQDTFLQAIVRVFREQYQSRWEKYTYHASEISSETILSELISESLFPEPQVVIIKEMEELDSSGQSALLDYLDQPKGEICLILFHESRSLHTKFAKQVKAVAKPVEVRIPWLREMDEWLRFILRQKDMEASEDVRSRLIELAGESLQQLSSELEKLATYLSGDQQVITTELLEEFVGETRTHSVYEFKDVLGTKSLPQILRYVFSLLEEGTSVSYILMITADFFGEVWVVKEMLNERKRDSEINKEVFNGRNLAWKYKKIVRRFTREELHQAFPLIEEADLVAKTTSALAEKNYLTAFFYEIFHTREDVLHE
ncbi:MAG TPA: DNA polymerase III subunit delta [bacterium]|nr:DNA polymerase III subunit delta [bacterium]